MYAFYVDDGKLPHQTTGSVQNKQTFKVLKNRVARAINKYRLLFSLALFAAIIISPQLSLLAQAPRTNNSHALYSAKPSRTDTENFYLNAINELRASKELKPLIIDSKLSFSANQKGLDMSAENYWGHYAPSGKSFADYIWQYSPKAKTVGENLAKCYSSRQDAFEALKASPTHYALMIGNFTNFGISEVIDNNNGCINTVMHFSLYT
jgi:uncharacterized protein YkwD